MGIEARYDVSITKVCDGCGERWSAKTTFRSVGSVLSFGGPVEAANWEIHISTAGDTQLLCERCVEHVKQK